MVRKRSDGPCCMSQMTSDAQPDVMVCVCVSFSLIMCMCIKITSKVCQFQLISKETPWSNVFAVVMDIWHSINPRFWQLAVQHFISPPLTVSTHSKLHCHFMMVADAPLQTL